MILSNSPFTPTDRAKPHASHADRLQWSQNAGGRIAVGLLVALTFICPRASGQETVRRYDFGAAPSPVGYVHVAAETDYNANRGFGFLNAVQNVGGTQGDDIRADACGADQSFVFRVDLPPGNYQVRLLLGSPDRASTTTVKVEGRRLMLKTIATTGDAAADETVAVNLRSPKLASGGELLFPSYERTFPQWDGALTIEFCGDHPAVRALEIKPFTPQAKVFLLGDSTVTDQRAEPYAGWGQMLTCFFRADITVANHASGGLTLRTFREQRRFDKVLEDMRPGDYAFIQFGHNDIRDKLPGAGPFTTYLATLEQYVQAIRDHEGIPVLVCPMERRRWADGKLGQTPLADYAEAVRQVGQKHKVPVIDLYAMSLQLYQALGETDSERAFVHYPANTFPGHPKELKDDTHQNDYGAYLMARCIVRGIQSEVPALATFLRPALASFDPQHPPLPQDFDLPLSIRIGMTRPDKK